MKSKREVLIVKILCVTAFGSIAMMLFSTGFPPRSGFFGTVLLIIATGILLRLQDEQQLNLINVNAKKFLIYIGCGYFIMTTVTTVSCFYNDYKQINEFLTIIKQEQLSEDKKVLSIKQFAGNDRLKERLSGFHLLGYELSENENDWKNVALARYYNIKGVRIKKDNDDNSISENNGTDETN